MLKGLKVLEFQGLAPSVFCGMYFADQGAQVILVARLQPVPFSMEIHMNIMNRNKKCIALSLKNTEDKNILNQLIKTSDVIIDPYRPGVLQKQGLGPQNLYSINPKIILLRVTGYGQSGEMALKPGHDLNYIASSGILKLINGSITQIQFPANYLADFVSASLSIVGTLKALSYRKITNEGSVVDCSLAGGCSYLTHVVKDQQILRSNNKNLIKYFLINEKRYVATQYAKKYTAQEKEIIEQIENMQKTNDSFVRTENFEIAEIKRISGIKNSQLSNPFGLESKQVPTNLPQRDCNREQILKEVLPGTLTNKARL